MRIIDGKNPTVVVLENVFGLLSHSGGETFETIIFELKKRDYDVKWDLLKCSDYGIPSMRRRLFIIASKRDAMVDVDKLFELDEYKKDTTLTEFFPGKNFVKKYAYTIRSGAYHSKITDSHNWSHYHLEDDASTVYRLTIADLMKLQGFEESFQVFGSKTQQLRQIGNTIPTNLTKIIATQIKKHLRTS